MIKRIIACIPSTITLMNLVSGVLACIMAFMLTDHLSFGLTGLQWAFIWICAAAVFDFLDGATARLLHAYSEIGKQLDSLSDLVSFGVAPALLVFNTVRTMPGGGSDFISYSAIFIAAMGALRLARFNVDTRQTTSFIGLPIPANAILWIGIVSWMQVHGYPGNTVMFCLILFASLMMVSNLPMFSLKFKNFHFRENFRRYVLILAALLFLITEGLPGLAWTILLYIVISVIPSKSAASGSR